MKAQSFRSNSQCVSCLKDFQDQDCQEDCWEDTTGQLEQMGSKDRKKFICFECLGDDHQEKQFERDFNQHWNMMPQFYSDDVNRIRYVLNVMIHPTVNNKVWFSDPSAHLSDFDSLTPI